MKKIILVLMMFMGLCAVSQTQVSVFNYPGLNGNGGCRDENENLIEIIDALSEYSVDGSITSFSNPSTLATQLDASTFFFMTDMESKNPSDLSFFPVASRTVIRDWVSNGGIMVMTGTFRSNDTDFLNLIFSWDLGTVNGTTWAKNTINTAGTPFESGPASLPYLSATDAISKGTVSNFTPMWGTDNNAVVATIKYGSGTVIFLGYDFYNTGPGCPANSSDWVQIIVTNALDYATELAGGAVSNILYTTADYTYNFSQNATSYYTVVAEGASAPTAAQIKSGVDYAGVIAVTSGNAATNASVDKVFNVTGLTPNTGYDIYAVSEWDNGGVVFSTISTSTFTTSARPLTITGLTGNLKVYDGTTAGTASGEPVLSGVMSGDIVTLSGAPVFTFASADVGTDITVNTTGYTITGADASNYTLIQPTLSADITAKELSITGISGVNKVYDGATAASASGTAILNGLETGDAVTLAGAPVFAFANADVGTDITVNTTGYIISGADASNYTLTQPTLSADITAKELSITGISGDSKVYDGTTDGSASGTATLNGLESGDNVSLGGTPTFAFASADVGTDITVNTTGYTISGADASNYTLTQPSLSADITAKELSIIGILVDSKVYDGTTVGSATGTATLNSLETGDIVNLGGSPVFTFASADVGTDITINTTGYTISGADASNYTLTQPTLSADITAKELSITGISGENKVYNGATAANATGTATLNGLETGDAVNLGGSPVFAFANADVGTDITVNTVGYAITGTDASNYTLIQPTLSADITAKELSITGISGVNKVYDGATAASASGTAILNGLETGDAVTLAGAPVFAFANADVGTDITVNTTGYIISGADASNYTLTQPTLSADITAKELSITGISGDSKVYDGTTDGSASGTAILNGLETGDNVSLGGAPVFTFASTNAGIGITLTASGYMISGLDAANYVLRQPSLSANIIPASLKVVGLEGADKVYDGTAAASATGTARLAGVLSDDDVSLTGVPTFSFGENRLYIIDMHDSFGDGWQTDDPNGGSGITVVITNSHGEQTEVEFGMCSPYGASIETYLGGDTCNGTPGLSFFETTAYVEIPAGSSSSWNFPGDWWEEISFEIYNREGDLVHQVGPGQAELQGFLTTTSPVRVDVGEDQVISTTVGYSITGADVGNYVLTQPVLSADITQAPLTIASDAGQTKVYGSNDPTSLTYTITGFVNNETEAVLETEVIMARVLGEAVGDYTITPSKATSMNYDIRFETAAFSITPAALTVAANAAQTKVYGADEPTLTYTITGYANGDTEEEIDALSITRAPGEDIGNYIITPVASDTNYDITIETADFSITKAALKIVADRNQTKIYGADEPKLTCSVIGLVNGDTELNLEVLRMERAPGEDVGIYTMILEAIDANYDVTIETATFRITPAALTVVANAGQTKVYGADEPTLTYTVTGYANGDTQEEIDALSITRAPGEDVGVYTITPEASDANYDVTIETADFSITPAALTIAANAGQTKVYGADEPALTYTVTGYKNGDTGEDMDVLRMERAPGEDVGVYTITPEVSDVNYDIAIETADFTITKAALTVTADDQTKKVGDALPTLTISYDGFVNGEGISDLDDVPIASTRATKDASVGSYPIELTLGADRNYEIITVEGTLTITADADGNVISIQKSYGISPNGDSINDTWVIPDIEKYPNNRVEVFNRSGKVVYEIEGYSNTFDGFSNKRSSSRKLPVGPYYFVLDLKVAGAPPIKGWIYINY